ncbi:hypothetical protein, partial [Bradyrhizobium sp. STM 3809]|uniref:hypothetical protein n=1 Tax=Bradyrhizobium sp. STM 3809 TaxID=551936 RepID=UPI000556678E
MARDSHKSAGAHGAEKTGGTLSGLFADETELDRGGLWRLGWWGAGAVGAVGLAIFVNQAAQGWRRDRISAADLSRQAQLLQSLAKETQSEARQLGSAIETLNTDRDQLYRRVTILEQNVELVTGALAKQSAQTTSQASAAPVSASKPTPAPQIAAVESQPTVVAAPGSTAPGPLPAFGNLSPFMPVPNAAAGANPAQPGATAAAPPAASTNADKPKPEPSKGLSVAISGPPGPTAGSSPGPASAAAAAGSRLAPDTPTKPADADRLAKADAADAATPGKGTDTADAVTAIQKTEFAVDLGGANTISGLRNLWRGLAKSNPDLAALKP